MKLEQMAEISRRVEQGAWVGSLPNLPDVQVKVRGYSNKDYQRLRAQKSRPLNQAQLNDDELMWTLEGEMLAEAIIEDWSGIEDYPYSKENALAAMLNPDLAVLRTAVDFAASTVARLGRATQEEAAKNS